jgi:hypothetical protein
MQLSKLNIVNGNIIEDIDVYQLVDALTFQEAYELWIKGSVSIGSGSVHPNAKLYVSGNFKVDGATFISASQAPSHHVLYYDTASGLISYGSDSVYVPTSSFNNFISNYNNFTESYYSDSSSFDNRFRSASLGVSQSLMYAGRTPATRNVGGINIGDTLSTYSLEDLLEQIVSPYTAPTLSLVSLTPASSSFNAQNVAYNVTFRWYQNVGTTEFTSAQIQYKRNSDFVWTSLSTSVSGGSSQKDASATVTVNTSGTNNDTTLFRCIFTDTQTNTTDIASSSFASYAPPTIVFADTVTPEVYSGGYMLRSINTPYTASISGSLSRNSPNINLSQYKISRDYNDSVWVDVNSLTSIAPGGGVLSPTIVDTTQPTNKDTVRYIAFVTDSHITAGQYIDYILAFHIVPPVLYGMSSATSIAGVDLSALTTVTPAQKAYTATSADKVVSGLFFTASSNRFCVAFDNAYGTLSSFFEMGSNLDLISNFTIGTKSVTFADGTTKTYTVALYNMVVVSGTYTVNIS